MGFLNSDNNSGDTAACSSNESTQLDPFGNSSDVASSSSGVATNWSPNVSAVPFVPGGLSSNCDEASSGWPHDELVAYGNEWDYNDEYAGYMDYGCGTEEEWFADSMTPYVASYHTTPDLNPSLEFDGSIEFQPLAATARNYKTQLCRHFTQKGHCILGSTCNFAHGDHELRERGAYIQAATYFEDPDEARSTVMSMLDACGALEGAPGLELPASMELTTEKLELLQYRLTESAARVPPELLSLKCLQVADGSRKPPREARSMETGRIQAQSPLNPSTLPDIVQDA